MGNASEEYVDFNAVHGGDLSDKKHREPPPEPPPPDPDPNASAKIIREDD